MRLVTIMEARIRWILPGFLAIHRCPPNSQDIERAHHSVSSGYMNEVVEGMFSPFGGVYF